MTERFAVVLCPSCHTASWIVEDIRHTERSECPSCSSTHQTKRLKVYYSSDIEEDAREARSQLLGRRSSADFEVERDSYYACREQAEDLYDELNRHYEEYVDASMGAHREKFADGADGAFSDWNELYASLYEGAFEDCDRRYETLVDEQLRQFKASEPTAGEGDLTFTDQVPMSAIADIDVGNRSPTDLWDDLSGTWSFIEAIIEAIRVSATGKRPNEFREELVDRDLPATYPELAVRIGKGDPDAVWHLVDDLRTLGQGTSPTEEIPRALELLAGSGRTPTVAVRIGSEFFDRRHDQRRGICAILTALARACDVRVVSSGIVRRQLAKSHREDLPGVSEACSTPRPRLSVDDAVEGAWADLNHDSREVAILRQLREQPSETLPKHAIESAAHVSSSRIRQCIGRLKDLGLVAMFDTADGKHVELLEAGSAFLSRLDAEIGRQAKLDACVSDGRKSCKYSRVSTREHEGGEGTTHTDRRQHGTVVEPTYLPRWRQAAVQAAATDGNIDIVDHPEAPSDGLDQPYVGYDDDCLVVGAEYVNPMQYWVCVARALTDRRVFRDVLTPERLDGDIGNLGGLVTDDTRLLRDARCLGWLKDADANGTDYAEALMAAEDELLELTRRWHNNDYSCSDGEFRSLITRHAHGMAGTVAHLCDLADVDLVRELRLAEFSRRFDAERRADLAKSIVTGARIASRHGHFAAYRQLYEDRDEKRAAAMRPSIPADDPTGELIGSFVLVGDSVSSFAAELREAFEDDADELCDDAPEFDVRVGISLERDRPAVAQVTRTLLDTKGLEATRESISLFHALAGDVYDVADAIAHHLSSEDIPREIRLDEVRVALAGLPAARILPSMPPTVSKITNTLLTAASPLSKSDIADRAGVSARSVATHLPTLEALGLVAVDDAGVRFELPFATGEERGRDIVPGLVKGSVFKQPADVVWELVGPLAGDSAYDPEHPIGQAFYTADPLGHIREVTAAFGPWIRLAEHLAGDAVGSANRATARFGPMPQQASLQEVSA